MMALETTASIANHRLVIEDAALPDHAVRARVIVLWESAKPTGRRLPPPELAGMGEEKGDILNGPPESVIIATAVEHQAQLVSVDGRFPEYLELVGLLVQE